MANESKNDQKIEAENGAPEVPDGSNNPSSVSYSGKTSSTPETDTSDIIISPCDLTYTHEQYIDYRETAKTMMYLIGEQLKYSIQIYLLIDSIRLQNSYYNILILNEKPCHKVCKRVSASKHNALYVLERFRVEN